MANTHILTIWERLLQTDAAPLPAEVARYALRLELTPADRARMGELAEKAQGNAISTEERAELEAYSTAAAFLTVLQSKARAVRGSRARFEQVLAKVPDNEPHAEDRLDL